MQLHEIDYKYGKKRLFTPMIKLYICGEKTIRCGKPTDRIRKKCLKNN